MKITGVRTRLYEFTAARALGDVNLPTGSDRGNGLAVFVDTDDGTSSVAVGSPGARATIHGLADTWTARPYERSESAPPPPTWTARED